MRMDAQASFLSGFTASFGLAMILAGLYNLIVGDLGGAGYALPGLLFLSARPLAVISVRRHPGPDPLVRRLAKIFDAREVDIATVDRYWEL